MMSSESEEMSGTIIMPMTRPAASADSEATDSPRLSPVLRMSGATVSAAKKPSTTVGTPARISSMGFSTPRIFRLEYSAI